MPPKGRDDVPDGLLFEDASTKAEANAFREEWKRYGFGLAIVESKRWQRPLDRQSGRRGEETAPSTQMLRYLRRVEDLTTGKLRWGMLTNGARWRLYYQGARSVSEQFFELDLAAVLAIPGHEKNQARLVRHARDGPSRPSRGFVSLAGEQPRPNRFGNIFGRRTTISMFEFNFRQGEECGLSYFDAESFDNSPKASCTDVINCAGKMMVEFLSTEISAIICRVRS